MTHTLLGYAMAALAGRDVSETYRRMVLAHCRSFARWSGRAVRIDELNSATVNAWLTALRHSDLSAETVDTYRRNLLMIWRDAFDAGVTECPPLRVKSIKKPKRVVRAYTLSELRRLLAAAGELRGRLKNGNRRADFWRAFLHAAYSTGLRRGDLLLLLRREIDADGNISIVQHKTGLPLRVRLSPEALAYIALMHDRNGLALPWPYRIDALVPRFRALRVKAGIEHGSLKWIRRAAGSYAERNRPGDGARLLGHSPAVFRGNYEDQSITAPRPIMPPPL